MPVTVPCQQNVKQILKDQKIKPIVLEDLPAASNTLVEKVEKYSTVYFANLGICYFIGKLGRKKVCYLVKGKVETPSDMDGIAYIQFNESISK